MTVKILIIEDDSILRNLIAEGLSSTYSVITAGDGQTGLELAREHLPELIVSDIAMPQLDGIAMLQHLRADERTQSIPLLFLTAKVDYAIMRQGMNMGADDYLIKPFHFTDLEAAIQSSLMKKALRDAKHEEMLNRLRYNITTSVPHELRTSVMVVKGYIHLLLDNHNLDAETTAMLNAIQRYAERLHDLTDKMYWYSLTEVLQPGFKHQCSVKNAAVTIQQIAAGIAPNYKRESDLLMSVVSVPLCFPQDHFERVLTELIENAFKFSESGNAVEIQGHTVSKMYNLSIKDYGRGIQSQHLKHINGFMQFERERYEQQGTGLGLTIAKRLVELSGGDFKIQSSPEEYTLVTVSLPLLKKRHHQ